jgi:DNA-binding HxlR family transcriptional regulator
MDDQASLESRTGCLRRTPGTPRSSSRACPPVRVTMGTTVRPGGVLFNSLRARRSRKTGLGFALSRTSFAGCLKNRNLVHSKPFRGRPHGISSRRGITLESGAFPFAKAAEALGDNWTLLIAREFARCGPLSFTELLAAIGGIATNILSDRLRRLVAQGILAVTPNESDGRKLVYSLSSKGSALKPMLAEIEAWGRKYYPPSGRHRRNSSRRH